MKLQIDFYSKNEVAFDTDHRGRSGNPAFADPQANDLFLFAAYTLRQFRNLGDHLVAKGPDGFFTRRSNYEGLVNDYDIPNTETLLDHRYHNILQHVMDLPQHQPTDAAIMMKSLDVERAAINPRHIQTVNETIIAALPDIIPHREAKGKKSFVLTTDPFRVDLDGIGIFSLDTNYYVFHSLISLTRFLLLRYQGERQFFDRIFGVGKLCADFHITNKINARQDALAVMVLMSTGVIEREQ